MRLVDPDAQHPNRTAEIEGVAFDLVPQVRVQQANASGWRNGMRRLERGDLLDRAFLVGIMLKGLDGLLEVVGGLLLLVVSPATITSLTRALTQHELSQDPTTSWRPTSSMPPAG
jgi:hypothetical protein